MAQPFPQIQPPPYNPTGIYETAQTVVYSGLLYVCLLPGTTGVAPSNSSPWKLASDATATYVPGNPANWQDLPASIGQALDQIAAVLTPIP